MKLKERIDNLNTYKIKNERKQKINRIILIYLTRKELDD